MLFQPFYKKIKETKPFFTLNDLKFIFPQEEISAKQLNRWQKKGYILKLKNGIYLFSDSQYLVHPFLISNLLYEPSYISLETALYEYGFIPDVTQTITSISTKKTWSIKSNNHYYSYRKIKNDYFIGYSPKKYLNYEVLIAEPEKAIIDFFYFNTKKLKTDEQINELRLNYSILKEKIDKKKLLHYTLLFKNKVLLNLINNLMDKF